MILAQKGCKARNTKGTRTSEVGQYLSHKTRETRELSGHKAHEAQEHKEHEARDAWEHVEHEVREARYTQGTKARRALNLADSCITSS